MRGRVLLVSVITLLVLACGMFGVAVQRSNGSFVLPGAADQQTEWHGATIIVRYKASSAPFVWRDELTTRLKAEGWQAHTFPNVGQRRPPFYTLWFDRTTRLGPLSIAERAILGNHPDQPTKASVEISRDIEIAGYTLRWR